MANKTIPAIQTNEGNVGIGVTSPRVLLDLAKANNVGQVLLLGEVGANIRVGFGLAPANAGMRIFSLNHITDGGIEFGGISSSDGSTWTRNHRLGLAGGNSFFNEQGGNVGIGTTSPGAKLDVAGGLRVTGVGQIGPAGGLGFALYNSQTNVLAAQLYGRSGGIQFTNGAGLDTVYIASGGNVGIGSTNPSTNLHIGGTAASAGAAGSLGVFLSRGVATNFFEAFDGTKSFIAGVDNTQTFAKVGTLTNHPVSITQNNSSAIYIDTSKNVGIGTTSPSYKLDVQRASDGVVGYFRRIGATINPALGIYANETGNSVGFNTDYAGAVSPAITFSIASSEKVRIANNGDVGIGTTSPSGRLSVDFAGSSAFNVCDSASSNVRVTVGTVNNAGTIYGLIQTYQHNTNTAGVNLTIQPFGGNVGIGITNASALFYVFSLAGRYINFTPTSISGLLVQRNQSIGSQGTTVLTLVNAQGPESTADRGTSLNLDIGYGGTSTTTAGTIARGARIAALNHNVYDATAANQNAYLAFYTATGGALTEQLRITANGNVGIGTTNPSAKLQVDGELSIKSSVAFNTHFNLSDGGSNFISSKNEGATFFRGSSNNITSMTVLGSGGVGIGITPTSKFHVVETTPTGSRIQLGSLSTSALMNANLVNDFLILTAPFNAVPASTSNNNAKWGIKMGGGSTDAPNALEKSACIYAVSEEDIGAGGAGAGYNRKIGLALHTSPFDLPNVERVRINNLGNVGIGTTNPTAKLQVVQSNAGGVAAILLSSDESTIQGPSANTQIRMGSNLVLNGSNILTLGTNNVTRMVIDVTGNVGIGTVAPTAQNNYKFLQVNGQNSAIIEAMVNNVRIGGIDSDSSSLYFGSIGSFPIVFRTAVVEKMRITAAGLVGIGTATPTTLLSVGGAGSTSAASGLTFGGDTQANLYRAGEDIIKTDATLQVAGNIDGFGTVQAIGSILHRTTIRVLNKAATDWVTWFTRDTSESETIGRLDNIRSINTTSGGNLGIGTNTPSGKLHVVSTVAGATVLRTDGTNGTLFSVVDDLSDSLMSVNNSAGLPVLEVFADDRVVAGQYGSGDFVLINNKVGLGTSNPTNKLSVIGGASIGSSAYNLAAPTNGLLVEGNVGVGTTSVGNPLEVYGTSMDPSLTSNAASIFNVNSLGVELAIGRMVTSPFSLWLQGKHATLNSLAYPIVLNPLGGNVGVGLTNPAFTLDVNGNVRGERYRGINSLVLNTYATVNPASNVFLYSQGNDRDSWLYLDSADTGSNWGIYHRQIDTTVSNLPGNSIGFIGGGANTLQAYISLANGAAYFAGNVGIGITNPASLLAVGPAGATSAANGLTFGGDAQANIYRNAEDSLATDGNFNAAGNVNSKNSRTTTYTSITSGASGDWFPLFQVSDGADGMVTCNIKTYAHSSASFLATKGYSLSFTHSITVLNCNLNPNGGYANITGVRIRENGWVEIQLSWSSGPAVNIGVQIIGTDSTPTFAANLSPTGAVDAIADSISLSQAMFRSYGNIITASSVGIGTTNPATLLHVNTAGADARIRVSAGANTVQGGMIANTGTSLIYAGSVTNHGFSLRTYDTDRVRIDTNGNVGVGTPIPTARLDVRPATPIAAYQGTVPYQTTTAAILSPVMAAASVDTYTSILQLVSVRQALVAGRYAHGYLGFSTVDNSNINGILDAGRISIKNDDGVGSLSSTSMGFWTNTGGNASGPATERVRIASNGNVGIGITNPGSKLDVNGSFRTAINNLTIFNDYLYVSPTENNTFNSAYSTNGIADMWINYAGYNNGNTQFRNFNVGNGKNAIIAWFDGTNKRMSINNAQSASYTLHVVGNAGFTDAVNILKNGSDSISAHLYVGNAANNRAYNFQPNAAGTNLALWAYNSSNAWINTVNFNYDGNVGIGASPVGARLHIKGDGSNPVLRVETAMLAGAAGGTASKTFVGWMPMQTGALSPGDTVYIPLYK